MLLEDAGSWSSWLGVIRCSMSGDLGLGFTLARSKKCSVISDPCPGQPNGLMRYSVKKSDASSSEFALRDPFYAVRKHTTSLMSFRVAGANWFTVFSA